MYVSQAIVVALLLLLALFFGGIVACLPTHTRVRTSLDEREGGGTSARTPRHQREGDCVSSKIRRFEYTPHFTLVW